MVIQYTHFIGETFSLLIFENNNVVIRSLTNRLSFFKLKYQKQYTGRLPQNRDHLIL